MRDVHVHFLHGNPIGYSMDFLEGFIKVAQGAGLDEIYLLEHTHQFTEFEKLAVLLNKHGMYVENSGGLRLNYSPEIELGLNPQLLQIFRKNNVRLETASDAHKQRNVGANIPELERMLRD